MIKYLQIVRSLVSDFLYWNITKVPRSENSEADRLVKYASVAISNHEKFEERIFVEFLPMKSTDLKAAEVPPVEAIPQNDVPESSNAQISRNSWMTPLLDYLRHGILSTDRKEAKSLMFRVANFILIDGVLYKRGFSFPYLRCLLPKERIRVLEDLHAGQCSNHIQV